jgi:hypothetical protein
MSIGTFFLVYAVESEIRKIDELYKTFNYMWVTPQTYFVIIFIVITVIIYQKVVYVLSKLKDIYTEINTRKALLEAAQEKKTTRTLSERPS